MSIGLAVGKEFQGQAQAIYDSLMEQGLGPDFILYVFPTGKRIRRNKKIPAIIRKPAAAVVGWLPVVVLKVLLKKFTPKDVRCPVYYVKDINSEHAHNCLTKEAPSAVILFSCGIISKRTCEKFHNILMNAHAGKLPEMRGVSNVEWTYLEEQPLWGTIQFTAPKMDTGDVVYDEHFPKLDGPTNVAEIRADAFSKVFSLFPKAIQAMQSPGFAPRQQPLRRTNWYVMHPFLKHILERRLSKTKPLEPSASPPLHEHSA